MNSINTTISQDDRTNAKLARKSAATYAHEILEHLETGEPFFTTFIDEVPREIEIAVNAQLKKKFELWANTWIAPLCREIIAKY